MTGFTYHFAFVLGVVTDATIQGYYTTTCTQGSLSYACRICPTQGTMASKCLNHEYTEPLLKFEMTSADPIADAKTAGGLGNTYTIPDSAWYTDFPPFHLAGSGLYFYSFAYAKGNSNFLLETGHLVTYQFYFKMDTTNK